MRPRRHGQATRHQHQRDPMRRDGYGRAYVHVGGLVVPRRVEATDASREVRVHLVPRLHVVGVLVHAVVDAVHAVDELLGRGAWPPRPQATRQWQPGQAWPRSRDRPRRPCCRAAACARRPRRCRARWQWPPSHSACGGAPIAAPVRSEAGVRAVAGGSARRRMLLPYRYTRPALLRRMVCAGENVSVNSRCVAGCQPPAAHASVSMCECPGPWRTKADLVVVEPQPARTRAKNAQKKTT